MKKFAAAALILGVCVLPQAVSATIDWETEDMSWWGNTGATPLPVKDSPRGMEYSGYWWWPTEPASNVDDGELWGNRGIVYHLYSPAAPPVDPPADPPVAPPTTPTRQIPVFNNVLFDFDRSNLRPEGKAETDKVVSWMNQYSSDTLDIEGHTDSIGTEAYNVALGQRRADAIKSYMVQAGIAASRITATSYGETSPAVPNDTPANRQLNRRGIFKISIVD